MVRGNARPGWAIIGLTTLEGLIFAYLGTPYLLGGWRKINFRLTSTPLPDLLSGLLGIVVGLVIAALIGVFVRDLPYGVLVSFVLALLLAALGASVGVTRRSELAALFFGGGRSEADTHRMPAVLLDTSVIIDGRILDIAKTGFLDMPLVILSSVLRELQTVADSADVTRRRRGRRGLDVLTEMQKEPSINLQVTEDEGAPAGEIDAHLVRTAKRRGWAIMTNDFNLNRIARLEGVAVLNLHALAQAMRPVALPGEAIVAAAGSGSRLGRGSKALVRLNGRTTRARVLELFLALDEVDRIVVVGPPSRLETAAHEVEALHPRKPVVVKAGGESRQESVRAGLAALGDCDFVLVHDAARPLATAALVRRVLAAAIESGAAFPAISPRD